MSNEPTTAWLAIRLEGPLQSWGFEDRFNRRKTGTLPTKSAMLGLFCAALGAARGSQLEQKWLPQLNQLRCLTLDLSQQTPRRMEDFHTVQNTRTADGKTKETHITHRTYLNDSAFAALFSGESSVVHCVAEALQDPVWGIWLGRKCCIPSAPVFAGVFESETAALEVLLHGQPLSSFTHQREVDQFADGTDTFMDSPLSFADPREFAPRRVKTQRAIK